jgi:biotin operon repressor
MTLRPTAQHILLCLLKHYTTHHTTTTLATTLNKNRTTIWKTLQQLRTQQLITTQHTGTGKTSTQLIHLNWHNKLLTKHLALYLAEEAAQHHLTINTTPLHPILDCLITHKKTILTIISQKRSSIKITTTQHNNITLTQQELLNILPHNTTIQDIIRNGNIHLGQEHYIQFMQHLHRNRDNLISKLS